MVTVRSEGLEGLFGSPSRSVPTDGGETMGTTGRPGLNVTVELDSFSSATSITGVTVTPVDAGLQGFDVTGKLDSSFATSRTGVPVIPVDTGLPGFEVTGKPGERLQNH